jgi:hypothetical protein
MSAGATERTRSILSRLLNRSLSASATWSRLVKSARREPAQRGRLGSVQHHHHKINDTFHCRRAKQESLILVYNQDSYLMAEYSERTGRVSWQRVVPVTQREAIERWLNEQYPVRKAKAASTAAANSK